VGRELSSTVDKSTFTIPSHLIPNRLVNLRFRELILPLTKSTNAKLETKKQSHRLDEENDDFLNKYSTNPFYTIPPTMKLFSTAMIALGALAAANAQSTLEEKWAISETPTFDYSSLDFSLTFGITDFILPGQAKYQMYTSGCMEEGTPLANQTSGLIAMELIDTANTERQDDVTLNQEATIKISVDPTTISGNTELYSEDTTIGAVTAQIVFCVRFGLHTPGDDVEVNFLETVITLDIDLSDGFEIGSIAVEPKDKLVRTAAQAYQVEGYVCTDEEIEGDLLAVRNQGAQIRVCVRPDEEARSDGIYMRRIDSFTWRRDVPVSITQAAVEDGIAASNTLTDLFCEPGELVCNFVSILFASFYATPGAVAGSGVASMQFGGDNTYIDLADGFGYQYKADGTRLSGVEFFKRRNLLPLLSLTFPLMSIKALDLSLMTATVELLLLAPWP
jgi:hypothetical protein